MTGRHALFALLGSSDMALVRLKTQTFIPLENVKTLSILRCDIG